MGTTTIKIRRKNSKDIWNELQKLIEDKDKMYTQLKIVSYEFEEDELESISVRCKERIKGRI